MGSRHFEFGTPVAPASGGDEPRPSSRAVLLVEDDDVDAERLRRWLRAIGWADAQVHVARTLHEAQRILEEIQPSIAVVDLTLPDASDLDVVQSIVSAAPGCAVVVQTSVEADLSSVAALEAGAQDYLDKGALTQDSLGRSIQYAETRHRLNRTANALVESDAELDDFAHVVAHDLRAPVRTARLLADRLLANMVEPDEVVVDLSERLDDALRRVDDMILSMLDYSALRGELPTVEPVVLRRAVADALAAVGADLSSVGATVETRIDDDVVVSTNPSLLQRALINVFLNSVKYAHPGRVLAIDVSAAPSVDGHVELRVADNGIGVAAENRERVFGLLERLNTASTGLGFGLAICRRVMDLCGGRVAMASNLDGSDGVTVVFGLPGRRPAVASLAWQPPQLPAR